MPLKKKILHFILMTKNSDSWLSFFFFLSFFSACLLLFCFMYKNILCVHVEA